MSQTDWDENAFPLAYLITFRCYGTWLHGDERESVDRHDHHRYGTARLAANPALQDSDRARLKQSPVALDAARRSVVEAALREVCQHRDYQLLALNVRTNHVHAVVAAGCKPEPVLTAFKAYATRRLREAGLCADGHSLWSRHGSTRYLWKPHHVELAIDYVINGQGDELPTFVAEARP